jgi:hypothetical protein
MRAVPEWANEPVDPRKFDRNAVELPRYADIERTFESQIHKGITGFQRGDLDRTELVRQFKRNLQNAETEAFVAGRRARGDTRSDISDAEAKMLSGRHSRNMRYFNRFVGDMEVGRGKMDYFDRGSMYAKSLWSLYTRGETTDWEDPTAENNRYYWVMDVEAEHCKSCIERAKKSRENDGFSYDELCELGWPGENTDCLTECRCHVKVVQKRTVHPDRFDDATPAATPEKGVQDLIDMLGGENMPLRLPVAGVPSVKLEPSVVEASVTQSQDPEQLSKLLPMVPKTLTNPAQVIDAGNIRHYLGYGMHIAVGRGLDGLWRILYMLLFGEGEKAA